MYGQCVAVQPAGQPHSAAGTTPSGCAILNIISVQVHPSHDLQLVMNNSTTEHTRSPVAHHPLCLPSHRPSPTQSIPYKPHHTNAEAPLLLQTMHIYGATAATSHIYIYTYQQQQCMDVNRCTGHAHRVRTQHHPGPAFPGSSCKQLVPSNRALCVLLQPLLARFVEKLGFNPSNGCCRDSFTEVLSALLTEGDRTALAVHKKAQSARRRSLWLVHDACAIASALKQNTKPSLPGVCCR